VLDNTFTARARVVKLIVKREMALQSGVKDHLISVLNIFLFFFILFSVKIFFGGGGEVAGNWRPPTHIFLRFCYQFMFVRTRTS
jgi:hypothetical protein